MKTKPKTYVPPEQITEAEALTRQAGELDRKADEDAQASFRFATAAATKRLEATDCRLKALALFFEPA